jgi:hypothetical protein
VGPKDSWGSNDEGADMGGKGETVACIRRFGKFKGPERDEIKRNLNDIIDKAQDELTIIVLAKEPPKR